MALGWPAGAIAAPPLWETPEYGPEDGAEEGPEDSIGYPTVEAARESLREQVGVSFTTRDDWIIATDTIDGTVWSFPPLGYPGYPAVVRRHVIQQGSAITIETDFLCEAPQDACDDLARTFDEMSDMAEPAEAGSFDTAEREPYDL